MEKRNWETLLLATLAKARRHIPGPYTSRKDIEENAPSPDAAHVGMDIDEILDMAYDRGHGWLPRREA